MERLLLRRFLLRRQVERESNRLPFVAYSFSFCNRLHPQSRDGLNEPPERGEKRKCVHYANLLSIPEPQSSPRLRG